MICAKTSLPWYIPHCLCPHHPDRVVGRRQKCQVENTPDASHPSRSLSVSGNPSNRNRTAVTSAIVRLKMAGCIITRGRKAKTETRMGNRSAHAKKSTNLNQDHHRSQPRGVDPDGTNGRTESDVPPLLGHLYSAVGVGSLYREGCEIPTHRPAGALGGYRQGPSRDRHGHAR